MITSIFSKSKPINFIIVSVLVIILFSVVNYESLFTEFNLYMLIKQIGKLLILLLSLFVVDFIISKNSLAQANSYTVMALGLLFALMPNSLKHADFIVANFLILLAMRRLLSLHSKLSIKKKLYDATLYISLAGILYFWAFLFLLVVFIAVVYYSQNDFKNSLIPGASVLTVVVIFISYNVLKYDTFFTPEMFDFTFNFDFSIYNSIQSITALTLLFTVSIWTLIHLLRIIRDKPKKLKPVYVLLVWWFIIALIVALLSPRKNLSEFIFTIAPLSIMLANYLEIISEKWFKEVVVSVMLLTPVVTLLL